MPATRPGPKTTIQIVACEGPVEQHVKKITVYAQSDAVLQAIEAVIAEKRWETASRRAKNHKQPAESHDSPHPQT